MAISARAIRAGAAYVELLVNDNKLVRGLQSAQRKLNNFGNGLKSIGKLFIGLGGAGVAGFGKLTSVFVDYGDQLHKMSARTGVSVESLSRLGFAAEQSGQGLETVEDAVKRLQRSLRIAETASKATKEQLESFGFGQEIAGVAGAFASLGLELEKLQALDPEQQFIAIAEKLSEIEDPTKRAGIAMQIFGQSGQKLLPLFADGEKGIRALTDQAKALGLTMSTDDAIAAANFADQLNVLKKSLRAIFVHVGAALAPVLTDLGKSLEKVITPVVDWIGKNRELVIVLAKMSAGVLAGGIALYGLGTVFSSLGSIIGIFAGSIAFAGSAIGTMGTLISALLSPIGAVVAGIGIAVIALTDWGAVGESVTSFLSMAFANLKDDALRAFAGISDAMAAGDIGLAAKILWATLKVEWQRGLLYLGGLWEQFQSTLVGKIFGLNWEFTKVMWKMAGFFADALGVMFEAFLKFANQVQKTWNSVSKFMRTTWAKVKGVVTGTDSAAEVARIEQEASTKVTGTFTNDANNALEKALAEQEMLIEKARKKLEKKNKQDLATGQIDENPELKKLKNQLADSKKNRDQLLKDLREIQKGETPALKPPQDQIEAGAMAFDSAMGDLRNTALELGTAESQSAIIDALTGRNNPQKDIAKATQETAKNTKKTQKDVSTQTTLMRNGVRLIVENA